MTEVTIHNHPQQVAEFAPEQMQAAQQKPDFSFYTAINAENEIAHAVMSTEGDRITIAKLVANWIASGLRIERMSLAQFVKHAKAEIKARDASEEAAGAATPAGGDGEGQGGDLPQAGDEFGEAPPVKRGRKPRIAEGDANEGKQPAAAARDDSPQAAQGEPAGDPGDGEINPMDMF